MKTRVSCSAIRLVAYTGLFVGTLIGHHAEAAALRIGLSVWDVGNAASSGAMVERAYVALYGDVIVQDHGLVVIRDQVEPRKSIRIDISRLSGAERHRINGQCSHRVCSEIITGFMVHKRLVAVSAGPFQSISPRPPPSPGPDRSEARCCVDRSGVAESCASWLELTKWPSGTHETVQNLGVITPHFETDAVPNAPR